MVLLLFGMQIFLDERMLKDVRVVYGDLQGWAPSLLGIKSIRADCDTQIGVYLDWEQAMAGCCALYPSGVHLEPPAVACYFMCLI